MSMEQSFCYNWQAGMAKNPILFDVHSEVAEALFGFLDDSSLLPLDALFQKDMDSLTSTPSAYGGEAASSILLPSPKRHRNCSDLHNIHEQPPTLFQQTPFLYPIVEPSMAVVAPADCSGGSSLSVQSVAARERRKRISEKTLELGRLIPGGTKMNTAEMLQAAFKYVNFLQAQVSILHLMASIPVCKCAKEKEMQVLLASPAIQERLSAEGMCIVPKEMVAELAADPHLQSRPLISRSMDQFIQSKARMEGCN